MLQASYTLCMLHTHAAGIIYKVFQGAMKIFTRKLPAASEVSHVISCDMSCDGLQSRTPEELALLLATDEYQETVSTTPFLYLTLDLPNVPLFSVSITPPTLDTHTQTSHTHTHRMNWSVTLFLRFLYLTS